MSCFLILLSFLDGGFIRCHLVMRIALRNNVLSKRDASFLSWRDSRYQSLSAISLQSLISKRDTESRNLPLLSFCLHSDFRIINKQTSPAVHISDQRHLISFLTGSCVYYFIFILWIHVFIPYLPSDPLNSSLHVCCCFITSIMIAFSKRRPVARK